MYLMMNRKAGDLVRIGEEIELIVVRTGRNRVRIGIKAPRQVPIRTIEGEQPEAIEKTRTVMDDDRGNRR